MTSEIKKRNALKIIVLFGFVSLFADVTYEGARSITGPYLGTLGASALIIGFTAGFGEMLGYVLRLLSGYLSDKTGRYWLITFVGYVINLLAVPLLALANRWEVAAMLVVMERFGKALRTPARDVLLSQVTRQVGRGWGFGLHEALDQIGAIAGPSLIGLILYLKGDLRTGLALLAIPAFCALLILVAARYFYPKVEMTEVPSPKFSGSISRPFWLYTIGVGFLAAGIVDYPLIAFHIDKGRFFQLELIPVIYAVAMGVDAVSALVFGRLYDRWGFRVIMGAALIQPMVAPLIFRSTAFPIIAGCVLWGIVMGSQESIMRAFIADLVPIEKRGIAFGIFHTCYGISWFGGSFIIAYLYSISIEGAIFSSVLISLLALVPLTKLLIYKQKSL
jgi:MFS family permease